MNGEGADRDREPSRLDRLDDPLERAKVCAGKAKGLTRRKT